MSHMQADRGSTEEPHAGVRWSEVESLLFACLERPASERGAALIEICAQHPQHSDALRRRFAVLSELGLSGSAAHLNLEVGQQLGDYRLQRRLGGGAMGIVYLAEQGSTGRRVALKVLRPEFLDEPRARERFRRELAAAAKLDHPGICAVYDAGEVDGCPYIAMRYVAGESLAQAIARTRQSPGGGTSVTLLGVESGRESPSTDSGRILTVIGLVERVARALHSAHCAGMVHRDIKPANILVSESQDPVIVDFGLVRDEVAAGPTLTMSNDILGTPAYMAPEQIEPSRHVVDSRTDVYALGAVLFECLALHPPFEAPGREALFRQILTADPPDARTWNPAVTHDLAVVVQKALEKNPARRYSTALDLAEDLRRVRSRELVKARPAGVLLRLRRWSQRNPLTAGGLATASFTLAAGLGVALFLIQQLQRTLAERQAGDVAALSTQALATDTTLAVLYAQRAVELAPSDPVTLSALYAGIGELREERIHKVESPYCIAAPRDGSYFVVGSDKSDRAFIFRPDGQRVELGTREQGHGTIHRIVVSPGGERILVLSRFDRRMQGGGLATIWNPDEPKTPVLRWDHPKELIAGCFTVAGGVFTACADGVARLWTPTRGTIEFRGHDGPVSACAASPDGSLLVTGGHDKSVRRWDPLSGKQLGKPLDHGGWVVAIEFARVKVAGSHRFMTATGYDSMRSWVGDPGYDDDRVRVFDADGKLIAKLDPRHRIVTARFSFDGRHVVTAGADQVAKLWSSSDEGVFSRTNEVRHQGAIYGVCIDDSGSRIATVDYTGTAYLWFRPPGAVHALRGHRICATGCCFVGDRLATCALDHTVRVWIDDLMCVRSWHHEQLVSVACVEVGGKARIAAAEPSGMVHAWDRERPTAARRFSFDSTIRNIFSFDYWPGGHQISERFVIGDATGKVHVFRADGTRMCEPVQGHSEQVKRCQFSLHGDVLLTVGYDGIVCLWNSDMDLLKTFIPAPIGPPADKRGQPVWDASFSPDGTRIATALDDFGYTLKVWNRKAVLAGEAQPDFVLRPHDSPARQLAFSADSTKLVYGTLDGSVWLADLERGTTRLVAKMKRDVTSVAISSTGDLVACGLMDGETHLLRTDGSPVLSIPSSRGRIRTVQFLDSDSTLLVGANPGSVSLWPTSIAGLCQRLRLARALSEEEEQVLRDRMGR